MPKPVYTPKDLPRGLELGRSGEFPFTRGIQQTMYRGQFWTMRQYAGFGTAEETNHRFKHLLEQGQTGLSIAFDLPTQMGFDPGHAMSQGEVGRVGVSIASIDDMETLLKDLPLDQVSTSMTINSTAAILLCFYVATAKRRGISVSKLKGTLQNDVLKEYIARGTYIYPPAPSLRLVGDIILYCAQEVPQWNPISISGYHIREAGSDASQEVGFTLANACAYAESLVSRGYQFDQFAARLSFFFNAHNHFLEEISKFRAARRLWAKLARDRFGALNEKSMRLRFHAQTAGSTLTAQQPENNLVRVAIQALSAVLGGCQSLHTNSKDEALSLPTENSATLALRTQQILADECGVGNTVDPLGGSYAVEAETQRIENDARLLIDEIDQLGGSVKAIERGYFQKKIADRAYQTQQEIEKGDRKIVGVNAYQSSILQASPILKFDPTLEKKRQAQLTHAKNVRNSTRANDALKTLTDAAHSTENLVPHILTCVESGNTLGEISDALRSVFGAYHATTQSA